MMLLVALLMFLISALSSHAQSPASAWAFGVQRGVAIVWLPPSDDTIPATYIVLRRSAGRGNYERIAETRRGTRDEFGQLCQRIGAGSFRDTLLLWYDAHEHRQTPDSVRQVIARELRGMILATSNTVVPAARWFGTYLLDSTARTGDRYDYAIESGGRRIATVEGVLAGSAVLPPKPTGLRAMPTDSGAHLVWDVRGTQKAGIWGFHIWRSTPGSAQLRRITDEPVATIFLDESLPIAYLFADGNLRNDSLYTYAVSAVDLLGREGERSDTVTVMPFDSHPLQAPYGLVARAEGDSVIIRWHPPFEDRRAIGYHVYRWQTGDTTTRQRLTLEILRDTIWVDRPRELEGDVSYAVTAVDRYGHESQLSLPHSVPVPDVIPPALPLLLDGVGDVGQARLRWSKSPSRDVWGYEVGRSLFHPDSTITLVSLDILTDTMFIETLPIASGRTTYWYRVRVVDRHGNRSRWSLPVRIVLPDIVPPQRPQLEEVVPGDGVMTLRWSQPLAEDDVAGFLVLRREGESTTDALLTPLGLPADARTFTDSTVRAGVFYSYSVVAYDSAGNRSKPSRRISAQCYDTRTPPVPEIDTLLVTADGVTLTWHYVGYVAEGTVAIIERSTTGEIFVPISPLLPATVRRYTDGSAEITEAYYYRIVLRSPSGIYGKPSVARASPASRRQPLRR
jgi:fibronectin type 3 domain-containing protein